MNGIVDVYEFYFSNLMTFSFDLIKRKQHNCAVCSDVVSDTRQQIYSREKTEKFIVEYLEHLKIFGFSIKTADLFISSVRENGILSQNVKGLWRIKKHFKYELYIIEHLAMSQEDGGDVVVEEF